MSGLSKKEGWIFLVKKSGIHPCQKMLGVLGSRHVEVVSATNFVGIAFSVQILHIKLRPHPKADFGIHRVEMHILNLLMCGYRLGTTLNISIFWSMVLQLLWGI